MGGIVSRLLCLIFGHRSRAESFSAYTWDMLEILRVRRVCRRCGKEIT